MSRPYEFYKRIHPDKFSDSEVVCVSKLDRTFFDYYLDTLTKRGEEKKFEIFCRRIAEKEICPNLLPQTGPTGGGDSKVDSETYPVSDQLSAIWYSGIGVEATKERWAFAFSAKQKWKAKVYSDADKIAVVNDEEKRGYKKIFLLAINSYPIRNELMQKMSCEKNIITISESWIEIGYWKRCLQKGISI